MPFMAIAYVIGAVAVLLCNISAIPGAIALIIKSAFKINAFFLNLCYY